MTELTPEPNDHGDEVGPSTAESNSADHSRHAVDQPGPLPVDQEAGGPAGAIPRHEIETEPDALTDVPRHDDRVTRGVQHGNDGDVDAGIYALWQQFAREPQQRVRDRLVLHYAPLVKYVAGRVGTGLPTHVDVGDLVQSGIFGLVDAIEKFEPERGLRFETYAMQRIRGAILDELRSQDWVPRVVRSRARGAERALERLGARLNRTPTDAELARELGISVSELRDLYGQLQLTSVVALEDLVTAGKGSGSLVETLPDDDAVDPVAVLVDQDNRRQLAEAVAQLTERDRVVVSLYYFESLTLAEIGKVLGVTESRVSQLHTRAVLRLRGKLVEQAGS